MNNIHIIIYSELKSYGGGRETWLSYFLPNIINRFSRVYIYALKRSGDSEPNLIEKSCLDINAFYTTVITPKDYIVSVIKQLSIKLKKNDICLFVGSVVEGLVSKYLKIVYGDSIKCIIWIRSIAAHEIANRHNERLYPIISRIEKTNLNSADAVITNGKDTFRYYKKYWWNKHKRSIFTFIPNAVNIDLFDSKQNWDRPDVIKCVFVGRFVPEKGGNLLIDGFNKLNKHYPELAKKIELNIWGKGELSSLHMPWNVHYHGVAERDQVPSILSDSHIEFFIVKNDDNASGGLSHSLLEGLASGCICFCSNIDAYNQIINAKNGILIDSYDTSNFVEMLRNIILDIMKKGEKYKLMSIEARKSAESNSITNHITKFLKIVNRIQGVRK